MKTFLRVIQQANLSWRSVVFFAVFTLLYVGFNLINFSVLIPILEVLFDEVNPVEYDGGASGLDGVKHWFYGFIRSRIDTDGSMSALTVICLIVLLSVTMANVFRYLADMCLVRLRLEIVENMRGKLFGKLLELPLASVQSMKRGDLTARVMNDIQEIETTIVYTLKIYLKEPVLILGYLFILVSISPELALYSLLLIPVSGLVISFIARKLKSKATETQEVLGEIGYVLDQVLTGLREIKSFNAQKFMAQWIRGKNQEYTSFNEKMSSRFQLAGPVSEVLGILTMVVILLIGGRMVLGDGNPLTASQFIAFLIVFSQVLAPAKALSQAHSLMQRGIASAHRVFEIIDLEGEAGEELPLEKELHFRKGIEFCDVSFSYGEGEVVKNVDFYFEKGKIYALTGRSGGGKSTLVDLILRFQDPTSGRILIDGEDTLLSEHQAIRNLFGVVSQDSVLFNDTVRNNLTLGRAVSDQRIEEALALAGATDVVNSLPDGLMTMVGERGMRLSGGERQRISIARAVIKDAPILILDEATTSLDKASEGLVIEALKRLMSGRTTIMITHQVDLLRHADAVCQLKEGQLTLVSG